MQSRAIFSDLGQFILAYSVSTFFHSATIALKGIGQLGPPWSLKFFLTWNLRDPPCTKHRADHSPSFVPPLYQVLTYVMCLTVVTHVYPPQLRAPGGHGPFLTWLCICSIYTELEAAVQRIKRGLFIVYKLVIKRSSPLLCWLDWFCHVAQNL